MAITYTDWRSDASVSKEVSDATLLADLRFTVRNLDNVLATLRKKRSGYQVTLNETSDQATKDSLTIVIAGVDKDIASYTSQRATATEQITNLTKAITQAASTAASQSTSLVGKDGTSATAPTITSPSAAANNVSYNIGGVKEAYFGNMRLAKDGRIGLTEDSQGRAYDDSAIYINNTPARVTDAVNLWTTSQASKGMIQTYIPKSNYFNDVFAGVDATTAADLKAATNITNLKKYGFQFLYNPATISMSIGGTAAVDYMKYVNSPPKVMPDSGGASGINFNIIVNRMPDMQYLTKDGTLRDSLTMQQVYGSAAPEGADATDLKEIYNKGTMYDVEYLLKTIVGFEMKTQFRGTTADLGFLIGRLVELHIGKSMRYLVTIGSIGITHSIFDNRMVPLYSTISINASRVPDFMGYAKEG